VTDEHDVDELLDALAADAREDDEALAERARESWAPWEAMAHGEGDARGDDEREALFAPADEATLDRFAEVAWQAMRGADDERPNADDHLARAVAKTERDAESEGEVETAAEVVPIRRWVVGAIVAAAAAALLFVVVPGGGAELPEYSIDVRGGDHAFRGDDVPDEVPTLSPGSRLALVLRPQQALQAAPEVRVFLVGEDGRRSAWDAPTEVDDAGAVRIAGTREALFGTRSGRWRVEVELRADADAPARTLSAEVLLPEVE